MRAFRWWLAVLGTLVLAAVPAPGDAQPVGSEFQVNTYTTASQEVSLGRAVAADPNGNFVVVWHSRSGQDGSGAGVFGQRYDSSGMPQGGEFRVNSYTPNNQWWASVASQPGGDFIVVWSGYRGAGRDDIFGQRYDGTGAPLGSEFRVNSYTTDFQGSPAIASDADGNFVVVWECLTAGPCGVRGQRYDSNGVRRGGEFVVAPGFRFDPDVASDAAGNFVVVYTDTYYVFNGGNPTILGQRFDAQGVPQGGEFQVDDSNGYFPVGYDPSVTSDASGNFVVAWSGDPDFNQFSREIFGRRYDSDGLPLGPQFQVNTNTAGHQYAPSAASDASGNFVVTWQNVDGSGAGVFGRRFDSGGVAQGGEFQVNAYTTGSQRTPAVAMTGPDAFAVVWTSDGQDGSLGGVFGQRFDFSGGPTVHVGDLDRKAKNVDATWRALVKTLVHDDGHLAESGVLVTFNVSGGVGTQTCTTVASGVCEVSVVVGDAVPSLTFTVTSLSKAGFSYDASANHDPDPDSNGTVIVVNQP
jgi:hypothetical protein